MKRRTSGKIKGMLAIAVGLVMCVSAFATTVFAANSVTGTQEAPAAASLVKYLKAEDQTLPTMNFEFVFEAYSYNGSTALKSSVPTVANLTAAMSGTTYNTTSGAAKGFYKDVPIGHGSTVETALLAKGAGIYKYKVTEKADTYALNKDGKTEELTYSTAEYFVTYQVVNGTSGPYISDIAVETADTNHEPSGIKVDPTPVTGTDFSGNGFKFENVYAKTAGPTTITTKEEAEKASLAVKKVVAGTAGNKATDAGFKFTVKIDLPASLKTDSQFKKSYTGKLVKKAGTMTDVTIDLTNGTATLTNVEIDDGDQLAVPGLPEGTKFEVTETAAKGHDVSDVITEGGTAKAAVAAENVAASGVIKNISATATNNMSTVTNTKEATTITGILVDNLPYIGVLALAVVALAAYVVSKRRKEMSEEA